MILNLLALLVVLQGADGTDNQFGGPLTNILERKIEKIIEGMNTATERQKLFERENSRLFSGVFDRIAEVREEVKASRKEIAETREERKGILQRLNETVQRMNEAARIRQQERIERIEARAERKSILERLTDWTPVANIGKRLVNAGWWLLLGLFMIMLVYRVAEFVLLWIIKRILGFAGRVVNIPFQRGNPDVE